MRRRSIVRIGAVAVTVAAVLAVGALSLRAYRPRSSWNVLAAANTATPTATPTPSSTPTPSPTATPTPTVTPTPEPTATPRPAVPAPNPPAVPGPEVTGERWVLVDIAAQTTTAMIGEEALYTALATTGKEGWETPRGEFSILYRVANETMTSAAIGAEEYYVLEDVLYTQYFTSVGHALHLNYWREEYYFGSIASSHGCVGMRLADAEFFWRFAGVGTRVVIV
jgi:lipoprotein-anchoring transpeptidase ErfK/SrfK